MTCREKLASEYPNLINPNLYGGADKCPHTYGYADRPDFCIKYIPATNERCTRCWDREYVEKNTEVVPPKIAYICDRLACEDCNPKCSHTLDISHAKNFEKVLDGQGEFADQYMEKETVV